MKTNSGRRAFLGTAMAGGLAGLGIGNAWAQAKGGVRKIVLGQSVPLTGAASEIGLAFAAGVVTLACAGQLWQAAPLVLRR